MPTYLKLLAQDLLEAHSGIPNLSVSQELCEALLVVVKKRLVKEGVCHLDGIGKLFVKRYAGSDNKKDPKTGISYKIPPRNIVRFDATDQMKKLVNASRPKRERV